MAVYNLFALNKSEGFWTHVTAFFGVDLGYYFAHRWEHVSNAGWAAHNMHHSSPDYNLVTAFRQGPDQLLVSHTGYSSSDSHVTFQLHCLLWYGQITSYTCHLFILFARIRQQRLCDFLCLTITINLPLGANFNSAIANITFFFKRYPKKFIHRIWDC